MRPKPERLYGLGLAGVVLLRIGLQHVSFETMPLVDARNEVALTYAARRPCLLLNALAGPLPHSISPHTPTLPHSISLHNANDPECDLSQPEKKGQDPSDVRRHSPTAANHFWALRGNTEALASSAQGSTLTQTAYDEYTQNGQRCGSRIRDAMEIVAPPETFVDEDMMAVPAYIGNASVGVEVVVPPSRVGFEPQ